MLISGRHRPQSAADWELPMNVVTIVTVIIIIVFIGTVSTWTMFSGLQETGVGFLGLGQSLREPCACCPWEICDRDTFLFFLPVLSNVLILTEPFVRGSTVPGNRVGQ